MIIQFGADQKKYYAGLIDCLRELYPFPDDYQLKTCDADDYTLTKDVFIYIENDKVIGTAAALCDMKLGHQNALSVQIEDVAVLKSEQGKGIGRKLVEHIVQKYKKDAYKIVLYCDETVAPFYEKLGFYHSCYLMRMDIEDDE